MPAHQIKKMRKGPEASEAEVIAGCKRGADWARRALFERHHRAIYRFLVAQCHDPSLAEDLVQDTFLRAYQAIPKFRGDARVASWMTRIALNCLYGVSRRGEAARRNLEQVQTGDHRAAWTQPRQTTSADHHERRDLVRRALTRLDRDDAAVIVLHDLQGYRYREIAESLEIAVGTVGSRLNRARERLRDIVEELSRLPEETTSAAHPISESETPTASSEQDGALPGLSRRVIWSK